MEKIASFVSYGYGRGCCVLCADVCKTALKENLAAAVAALLENTCEKVLGNCDVTWKVVSRFVHFPMPRSGAHLHKYLSFFFLATVRMPRILGCKFLSGNHALQVKQSKGEPPFLRRFTLLYDLARLFCAALLSPFSNSPFSR